MHHLKVWRHSVYDNAPINRAFTRETHGALRKCDPRVSHLQTMMLGCPPAEVHSSRVLVKSCDSPVSRTRRRRAYLAACGKPCGRSVLTRANDSREPVTTHPVTDHEHRNVADANRILLLRATTMIRRRRQPRNSTYTLDHSPRPDSSQLPRRALLRSSPLLSFSLNAYYLNPLFIDCLSVTRQRQQVDRCHPR